MVNWDNRIRGVVRLLGGSGQVVHQARITFLNGTKIARSGSLEHDVKLCQNYLNALCLTQHIFDKIR